MNKISKGVLISTILPCDYEFKRDLHPAYSMMDIGECYEERSPPKETVTIKGPSGRMSWTFVNDIMVGSSRAIHEYTEWMRDHDPF